MSTDLYKDTLISEAWMDHSIMLNSSVRFLATSKVSKKLKFNKIVFSSMNLNIEDFVVYISCVVSFKCALS